MQAVSGYGPNTGSWFSKEGERIQSGTEQIRSVWQGNVQGNRGLIKTRHFLARLGPK